MEDSIMNQVYDLITNQIIEELQKGKVPWNRPWNTSGNKPKNLISGKDYQGINTVLLGMKNFSSPYWLTFKQCKKLNGQVKKGSKGSMVVFYTLYDKKNVKTDETDVIPVLRYYKVFNVMQCEGLSLPDKPTAIEFNPIDKAESIINNYKDKPIIEHGFNRACYIPSKDKIELPDKTQFKSTQEYYSTCFHEMVHSTKHETRLNRNCNKISNFGSIDYSYEELVAEIGNSFLCNEARIENTFKNSIAYIQNWLQVLKNDNRMIISCASKAEKATNYILNK